MTLRQIAFVGLLLVACWHGWQDWHLRAIHPTDGVLAPNAPLQTVALETGPVRLGRWSLTPRAHYVITARILRREDYHFDAIADLVPEDLALGWGRMSDNRVLAGFEIDQGARFYSWRTRNAYWPIPREEIVAHSANTHVIPANGSLARQLGRLRIGQLVRLEGELVDGDRDDGATLRTSLTRSDSGGGACEVLLVRQVETP